MLAAESNICCKLFPTFLLGFELVWNYFTSTTRFEPTTLWSRKRVDEPTSTPIPTTPRQHYQQHQDNITNNTTTTLPTTPRQHFQLYHDNNTNNNTNANNTTTIIPTTPRLQYQQQHNGPFANVEVNKTVVSVSKKRPTFYQVRSVQILLPILWREEAPNWFAWETLLFETQERREREREEERVPMCVELTIDRLNKRGGVKICIQRFAKSILKT